MADRFIIYCVFLLLSASCSYAQKRQTIDRTKKIIVAKKKSSVGASSTKSSARPKSSSTVRKKSSGSSTKVTNKTVKRAYLMISSESAHFGSEGGTMTFTVSSSGPWYVNVNTASWGHVTRSGNTLTLRVEANTGITSRSDYFKIKSGNIEKRIDIYQNGAAMASKHATIKKITVSNDADVDGKKGLAVHVTFDISGMKGKNGMVACYFYDSNGNALIDTNNSYGTDGSYSQVAVSKSITPRYDNSTYSDLEIKIPYDELHLSGTYSRTLRADVVIWDYSTSEYRQLVRKENTAFTCKPNTAYLKIDGSYVDKVKSFGESGGREYYSVSTSANTYETWGVPLWCSIENKNSNGFTLVCKRNPNRSSRKDYMKVKAAGQEIRIDIEQAANSGPTASIENVWVDYNVFNGMVKGMKIHSKYTVEGMYGKTINYCLEFYYADNTTPLKSVYGNNLTFMSAGVANYESCVWNDSWIFVPYSDLNMARGFNGTLSFDVIIKDGNGNKLARKNNITFKFSNI